MIVLQRLVEAFKRLSPMPELLDTHTNETLAWDNYRTSQAALEVFESTMDVSEQQVLDVGCGLGGRTVYYAEQAAQLVVGLEISEMRAHVAQAFANQHPAGAKVQIVVGDAAHLPFRADIFDCVMSTDTWEHLQAPILALRECGRVVKLGGTVSISALPYFSPWGAHTWPWLPLPWIPSLLPKCVLFGLVSRLELRKRVNAHFPSAVRRDWTRPNDPAYARRLTVAALEHSLSVSGMMMLHFTIVPVGTRYGGIVAWLTHILVRLPVLRELLAGMVVIVMRKPSPSDLATMDQTAP